MPRAALCPPAPGTQPGIQLALYIGALPPTPDQYGSSDGWWAGDELQEVLESCPLLLRQTDGEAEALSSARDLGRWDMTASGQGREKDVTWGGKEAVEGEV